jgi:hypothetical protein
VTEQVRIHKIDGEHSLTFYCGELPADAAVVAAGHEPNGYFWEGVATFLASDIVAGLELDSEAGMFCAVGPRTDLERLRGVIEPVLGDGTAMVGVIQEAHAEGVDFDD